MVVVERFVIFVYTARKSFSPSLLYSGFKSKIRTLSGTATGTASTRFRPDMASKGGGIRGFFRDRGATRESIVFKEKERILGLPIEEKRKIYRCGRNYIPLDDVETWAKTKKKIKPDKDTEKFKVRTEFSEKVSVWKGDITKLEIDAIANAANNSLLGGGGVDGAIHSSAGSGLRAECETLNGCDTGDAKITGGFNLPARYVIHTVGPVGEKESKLRDCYSNCLKLMKDNQLRSLAFPCISTGVYGYPNRPAAHVALDTVRKWMETDENHELVDRIIFCMFLPTDLGIYKELMQTYFPDAPEGEKEEVVAPSAKADTSEATPGEKQDVTDEDTADSNDTKPTEGGDNTNNDQDTKQSEESPAPQSTDGQLKS